MKSNKHHSTLLTAFLCLSIFLTSGYTPIEAQNSSETIPGEQAAGRSIFLPLALKSQGTQQTSQEWSTVAGSPQRTSWISDEVRGDIPSGSFHVLWYRPIEAYIPQNVQVITSNGVAYIATSRGLYALDANNGSVKWRFDTQLPIGNSPTVQAGVVYVGGYDRKIHALNASSGVQLWEFAGAQAGYSTNPLVINGLVIAGNRDGYMYAIGAYGSAQSGQLVWKYKTGGPINLSAAYKNGVVYFASIDNYAYALDASTGVLKWKSQRLIGDGYQSYWPVVFTDPNTNQDLVIFSSASGYRWASSPGDLDIEPWQDLYSNALFKSSNTLGPTVSLNDPWAQGKTVVNYSRVIEYMETNPSPDPYLHKPWRREYVILNTTDGTEYTFDSDRDGNREYAPILPAKTGSGNNYPPVVGKDGLLYFSNLYFSNGQYRIMGWRPGTQYLSLSNNQGDTAEPIALSGAGNLIYKSICCDRVGDWFDINNPSSTGLIWQYGYPLSNLAPGYDQMWWFLSADMERLYGNYGNVNGIYHNHGIQNPVIPHQGKYFIHRSNAVIAFGSGQVYGKLPLLTAAQVTDAIQPPTDIELKARLEDQVSKIIAAGHLRPGYYNAGQFNEIWPDLGDYFDNPGDTILALAKAYPYLSPDLQIHTKAYLRNEFQAYFDPVMYSHIGWADGAAREAMPLPPEVQNSLPNYPKNTWAGYGCSCQYPQQNFYAMWKYALVFPSDAGRVYDLAKSKLEVPVPTTSHGGISINEWFAQRPYEVNTWIAGYVGFLKLQELAGMTTADSQLRTSVTNELNRLLQYRANTFSKNTYYTGINLYQKRTLNVARNFLYMTPELGDYLRANALTKIQTAITEYNNVGPYWLSSRYDSSIGESGTQNLYDYPAMFQAKAYILKEPRDQLTKYLDAPAFEKGDLFFIQNLVASIEASGTTGAATNDQNSQAGSFP